MEYMLLGYQFFLTTILFLAAGGKLLQSSKFVLALRLSRIPRWLLFPLVVAVPTIEICLSIGLIITNLFFIKAVIIGIIIILSMFTIWMIKVSIRKIHIKCGCFGTVSDEIGIRSILRNILLLVLSLVVLIISFNVHALLLEPSLWKFISMISLELSLLLFQAFWYIRPGFQSSSERMPISAAKSSLN